MKIGKSKLWQLRYYSGLHEKIATVVADNVTQALAIAKECELDVDASNVTQAKNMDFDVYFVQEGATDGLVNNLPGECS
jgi:hypothetical protein